MSLKDLLREERGTDPLLFRSSLDAVEQILPNGKASPVTSRLSHRVPLTWLGHLTIYTSARKLSQLNSYVVYDFR